MTRFRLAQRGQFWLVRWILSLYEFCASLQLAVILILSVAVVLAVATFVESTCGTQGVQWYIYQTPWFLGLLALLALNIFCAAAIRFPWKRHQTGFVITHIGLLVLLFGAAVQYKGAVNSQMLVYLKDTSHVAIDLDHGYLVASGLPGHKEDLTLPLKLGPFSWKDDPPSPWYRRLMSIVTKDDLSQPWKHAPVTLYQRNDVKLELVDYYSRSETIANTSQEPFSSIPYLKLRFKLPAVAAARMGGGGELDPIEIRYNHRIGFTTAPFQGMGDINFWRIRDQGEFDGFAKCIPTRQVEGNGMVVVSVNGEPVDITVNRLIEEQKSKKPVELAPGLTIELVKFAKRLDLNAYLTSGNFVDLAAEEKGEADKKKEGDKKPGDEEPAAKRPDFPAVEVKVHYQPPAENGKTPPARDFSVIRFPLMPFLHYLPIADTLKSNSKLPAGVLVEYFHPMIRARIDIVESPANTLAYRVWQQKTGRIVSSGPLELDKQVDAFSAGGGENVFRMILARYIPQTPDASLLPGNPPIPFAIAPLPFNKDAEDAKMNRTIRVRLTWKDKDQTKTKECWLRQNLPEPWESERSHHVERIALPDSENVELTYRPRETPIGFSMRLDKFDLKKDAGIAVAANYTSHVTVFPGEKKPEKGETGKDFIITMNAPLDYPDPQGRTLRFFQENYIKPQGEIGQIPLASVFRVNYDPGRWLKYLGSLLITVGIFLMFYMRAYFFKPASPRNIAPAAVPNPEPASAQTVRS